jgi:hypothetical protein
MKGNSMHRLQILAAAICLLTMQIFATTSISVEVQDVTQMQAKVTVRTDQPGYCTYRASAGNNFSVNLPDITYNGATDARPGSLIDGHTHVFVLGTRAGNDALANGTHYWVGATCGTDPEVDAIFTTRLIPWGNMAPDPVPFNSAKFGNMDYPVIDWTNQMKSYVDPITGVPFWRLTGPAQLTAGSTLVQFNNTAQTPRDLTGSNQWNPLASAIYNGAISPASLATASGGTADKIFVPLAAMTGAGWNPGTLSATDDVLFHLFCGNASQAGITISAQFTLDGGQTLLGSPVTSASCPAGAPAQVGVYPQPSPKPLFLGWGMNPPQHNLIIPPSGTVNVTGSVVTLNSPGGSANYFQVDWPAGTPIRINGNYYHIASIQSPAQLTIQENPGALSNVAWSGANSGIVLWKSDGGTVAVAIGVDTYASSLPDMATNGDIGMVNLAPVSVSKSADGTATFNPPLVGYLMALESQGQSGSILLWIPYNQDGSVRNETRLLSTGSKQPGPTVNFNGDTSAFPFGVGTNPNHTSAFDGVTGNSWFGLTQGNDGKARFFKMTYDESLPGCAGFVSFNPFPASGGYNVPTPVANDCFQYFNLTPASQRLDVVTQMKSGYQTGLNANGIAVGLAHPGFDLGWFGVPAFMGLSGGGLLTISWGASTEHLNIVAGFDAATGVLKTIRNAWGSDAAEARWCGMHGVTKLAGSWRWADCNPMDAGNAGTPGASVFNSAFDMPVIKVNRANYGAPPIWDSNTATVAGEAYNCAPDYLMPKRYQLASMQALGYTGAAIGGSPNCLQVKVSTPPCNATPNTSYTFPDGKHEAAEFPCITPGFGNADVTRSKLMDLAVGDWMWIRNDGQFGEQYVVLSIAYNGTRDIDLWLLRWARRNYMNKVFPNSGDDFSNGRPRAGGWLLSMAPSLNMNSSAIAIDLSLGASARFLPDNGMRAACHGVVGAGSAPGFYSYMEPCEVPFYRGNVDMTPADMIFTVFLPTAGAFPGFAGSTNGVSYGNVQNYNNASYISGAASPGFQLDFRHLNPTGGSGPETLGSTIGASRTVTLVSGTTKSYLIDDTVSAGAADYKRLPLHAYAGHYLLQDVSSPATGNTSDLPDYSVCRALNADECFQGSAPGNLFVTVPKAYIDNYCRSGQFTLTAPCAFQLAPLAGQVIQFRLDVTNSVGSTIRKFGYVHGMPGLQYQFSNCRATPDAAFAFCLADWLDGVRSEWIALQIAPLPAPDITNRTAFVPVTLTYQGTPDATYIRARFGYLENGGSLLRCTPYQADCSTEIPTAQPNDPYGFVNEALTRQSCLAGGTCTISIPAIPNRMLYFVVDRLDATGAIVVSYPMQVLAVP